MSVLASDISAVANRYLATFPDERGNLGPLLRAIDETGDLTSRSEFRGHVTCGVVLIDRHWRVLHIEHRMLDRWLLPGGHVAADDNSLVDAALRELHEETGIGADAVVPALQSDGMPLDVDVHVIPDNPARNEPSHLHFDFRHVFRGLSEWVELQEAEIARARWLPIDVMSPGRLTRKLWDLQRTLDHRPN